jgi:hypothetical protein
MVIFLTTVLCVVSFSGLTSAKASSFFEKMSEEDKKRVGFEKLSTEERANLEEWVQANSQLPAPKEEIVQCEITDMQDDGMITLSDGETYEVFSSYRKKVKKWAKGDAVRLIPSKRTNSYKLEHIELNQPVGVKKIIK